MVRHGAQLHVGWAMVEHGVPVEDLLAAAERALMESRQSVVVPQLGVAPSLLGLHAAITAHAAERVEPVGPVLKP